MTNVDLSQLNNLGGWEYRPNTIARVVGAWDAKPFWEEYPELKDAHKGKVVMHHKPFHERHGINQAYRRQSIGNCVGRGITRAVDILQCWQNGWQAYALSAGAYGGARYEIGYEKKGSKSSIRGDGAVVAWAVECATDMGVLLATKITLDNGKTYDFTGRHDDDSLDKDWGRNGIPNELEPIMERTKVQKWNVVRTGLEAMDAIASGMGPVVFGTSLAHWTSLPAKRSEKGFLKLRGSTAHCWIATGSVDDGNVTGIVLDNRSWGNDWVTGPDGGYPLGPGRYLSDPDDFTKQLNRGEGYVLSAFAGGGPAPPDVIDWITL